jgi:Protein of unknown function (DUF1569)
MRTFANPEDKQVTLVRLAKVRPDHRARWGRMSAHQMLCHLNDSFLAVMGEKYVSPASAPLQRTIVKWVALYAPIRWPKGVPTRPEMDQYIGGTAPVEFEQDKQALVTVIERFSNPKRDFKWSSHPIFGNMPNPEWLRWGYVHTDHHLRQFGV